jgi:integrase
MSKRGAGEGSIYEEQPGKWVASITAGYEFKDGKRRRIRKKFSASTRGAVQKKLTEALSKQQTGYDISPQTQTVGQFLKYWVDSVVPGSTKPKTEKFYRYVTSIHLIPTLGKIQIQKLSAQHVQALVNDRLGTAKLARATKPKNLTEPTEAVISPAMLSPRSVRHIHRTLCTALETAVKHGFVQRNVATLVDPPRVTKAEMKFLSIDQARAVLAAAAAEPLYALYATILSLGLRLGEALGLAWDDVDFAKGRIKVWRELQRVNGVMTLLEPKTEGSHRRIDLPAVTIAALREHQIRQQHAREWAASGWKGNRWDLVFTTSVGTPLDERAVLRRFQDRILKKAHVPKMRIHDLRHSAVAILMAQGVDARSISELLGHSSVAFTLQVYGHLMEETKRETANKMDAALAPQKPEVSPVAPFLAPSGQKRKSKSALIN